MAQWELECWGKWSSAEQNKYMYYTGPGVRKGIWCCIQDVDCTGLFTFHVGDIDRALLHQELLKTDGKHS